MNLHFCDKRRTGIKKTDDVSVYSMVTAVPQAVTINILPLPPTVS